MIQNAKLVAVDYDAEAYHKQEAERGTTAYVMGRSALGEFARCPSRWKAGYERKDSDSTDYGSLLDCLLLTPDQFDRKFVVKPETYYDEKSGEDKPWNANSKVCKEWLADHEGLEAVKKEDFDEAKKAIAVLKSDPAIADYLKSSQRQVYCTAEWNDPTSGIIVPLKILIDLVPDKGHAEFCKTLGDFKTGRDAAIRAWSRQVFNFEYHVQAALYLDVFNAATGEKRNDFRHIIQENVAPYQTAKRYIASEFINAGRGKYQSALTFYAWCLRDNHWPDYDHFADMHVNGWAEVSLESWMVKIGTEAPPPAPSAESDGITP